VIKYSNGDKMLEEAKGKALIIIANHYGIPTSSLRYGAETRSDGSIVADVLFTAKDGYQCRIGYVTITASRITFTEENPLIREGYKEQNRMPQYYQTIHFTHRGEILQITNNFYPILYKYGHKIFQR